MKEKEEEEDEIEFSEDVVKDRDKDKAIVRNVIFVDMGASQTTLTLVRYDFPEIGFFDLFF
jgi:hypothetical protein